MALNLRKPRWVNRPTTWLQEGDVFQPDPRSAPSAVEVVTVAAAASDGMAMDSEGSHRPDAGWTWSYGGVLNGTGGR